MKALAAFILRGRLQAAAVTATFGVAAVLLAPVLYYVSGAALALVLMRHGIGEGLWLVLSAGGLSLLPVALKDGAEGVLTLFGTWTVVILCASVLRLTTAQGLAVVAGACAIISFAVVFRAVVDNADSYWLESISRSLQRVPTADGQSLLDAFPQQALETIASYWTGAQGASLLTVCFGAVLIGRWWQALLFNPGGFSAEFRQLRLPQVGLAVLAVATLLSAFLPADAGPWGIVRDVCVIVLSTYLFQGLAVMHHWLAERRGVAGWILLLALAVLVLPMVTLVLLQFLFMVVVGLGLIDSAFNLRRTRPATPDE